LLLDEGACEEVEESFEAPPDGTVEDDGFATEFSDADEGTADCDDSTESFEGVQPGARTRKANNIGNKYFFIQLPTSNKGF
jgi:hypothetical protein